ncbi:hypothetical protein NUU61_006186 [Penicillium alfredii]|uniref:Uncharacterized protein n=1 Tax=Penicillium alfredii TaxID=1506179 RepID=A0A9W9F0L6_9EURO|nr:uncharacterized protein NUU61_006186 [Penicillium alfredii]KAJ5091316.1 hypothetical protein NUU61_006186 [Penicillium alfredii]
MGQRHNRRRTRPRSKRNSLTQDATAVNLINHASASLVVIPSNSSCESLPAGTNSLAACISRGSPAPVTLAPIWHSGYTAWQTRERTSRLEASGLETEQCRLFGGEPGDDLSLCDRMLEYFGGLDYIDS